MQIRLPAEWEPQSKIQLTFPHAATDWKAILEEALACFVAIAKAICPYQNVLIVHHPEQRLADFFAPEELEKITFVAAETNDTWARDHAPLTILKNNNPELLNFQFNGWGLKFAADKDNVLTTHLHRAGVFANLPLKTLNTLFEQARDSPYLDFSTAEYRLCICRRSVLPYTRICNCLLDYDYVLHIVNFAILYTQETL